jgi:pimeloyl-ACP methyl ester carboxylesterase
MKLNLIIITFLLLTVVKPAIAQDVKAIQHDMETTTYGKNAAGGKYADIRGFKMYYEVYGKGEPLLIIGWSDGGINGLLMAIRHPDKVKKLAITGANLWPDSTAVDPFVYKWGMDENEKLKKEKVTPEIKNQLKLAHLLSYEPHISVAQLNKISCPTLVIGGDHDVILPKHTMLIAESIPNSYLWLIPNSGHSTPVVKKDILIKR